MNLSICDKSKVDIFVSSVVILVDDTLPVVVRLNVPKFTLPVAPEVLLIEVASGMVELEPLTAIGVLVSVGLILS